MRGQNYSSERRQNTIITLGSKGSLAYDGTQFIYSPAFPAVVKNTAGAGDAFNGALASGPQKESHRHPHCATPAHLPLLALKRLMSSICRKTTPFFIALGFTLQTNWIRNL